jgi:hypothetical protein
MHALSAEDVDGSGERCRHGRHEHREAPVVEFLDEGAVGASQRHGNAIPGRLAQGALGEDEPQVGLRCSSPFRLRSLQEPAP